ncbi:CHCH domain containing protein [Ditylenchus destructor]|nr:CHCH domain containing protein [Ditylenchus destructor]
MRQTDVLLILKHKYKGKPLYRETEALSSTNARLDADRAPQGDRCVQEMQNLFACLKSNDFDDIPCSNFKDDLLRCTNTRNAMKGRLNRAFKEADVGTKVEGYNRLTVKQFNKLMQQYPQPGIGKFPFHFHKRLPTMSYSDDLFGTKHLPHKKS